MAITYCYGWNELLREPRDPYREAVARRRHERGQLYTALFGDPKSPQSFVEVRLETEWIGLTVLDASSRRWRMWSFDGAPANERFFLGEYQTFSFDEGGASATPRSSASARTACSTWKRWT